LACAQHFSLEMGIKHKIDEQDVDSKKVLTTTSFSKIEVNIRNLIPIRENNSVSSKFIAEYFSYDFPLFDTLPHLYLPMG